MAATRAVRLGDVQAPRPGHLLALQGRQLLPVAGGEGAVEGTGIDHLAGADVGVRQGLRRAHPGGAMTTLTGMPYLPGEGEVPRVVAGHAHHDPGAVGAQDVVGDPQLDALPVQGIDGVAAGEDARLLPLGRQAVDLARPLGPLDVRQHLARAAPA